jgi:transposase
VVLTPGAGVAVPTKTVMACRVTPEPTGHPADGLLEVRAFGTLRRDLLALADWWSEAEITPVAMESTGEDWTPVSNLRGGPCTGFLGNAAHVKTVPGRKTARAEARWRANLMRYGVLQASSLPPVEQRDLRDLTRYRTTLVPERSREGNRGQGVLERATINIASGASEIMGVSGRALLAALLGGRAAPATMAAVAKGRLRRKRPRLEQALPGLMREHQRRLLARQWAQIAVLEGHLAAVSPAITRLRSDLSGAPTPPAPVAPGGAGEEGGSLSEPTGPAPP